MKATILIVALAVAVAASAASAATISGPYSFDYVSGASGTGSGSGPTVGGNITFQEDWTANGALSVFFSTSAGGGTTTDYGFTKTVTNNTGVTWTDFLISWPCLTTNCDPPPLTNAFQSPPTISGPGTSGAVLAVNSNSYLEWTSLSIPSGQTATFTFELATCGVSCYTGVTSIVEVPSFGETTTPEPASLMFVGLGLASIAFVPLRRFLRSR